MGQYYNAYTPHLLYVCASFFFEHLFLMTWRLASLGKGYRDFPLHMGTENIFHTTGTTGNRAVHTLAFTVTLISTLDLISQRRRMFLTEFKATRQTSFTASATNATETQCLVLDFSSFLGLVLWHCGGVSHLPWSGLLGQDELIKKASSVLGCPPGHCAGGGGEQDGS